MSHARVCDGCGKVQIEKPYTGWWRVAENDGSARGLFSDLDEGRSFHICSWPCLADLALKHADEFSDVSA